jgi:hypothetical protein
VASPYHKGRARVIYDPQGYSSENIVSDSTSTTVAFNKIIDLGKDTDVEIRVPYQQALAWLYTNIPITANIPFSISTTPTWSLDDRFNNGSIVVRVLTALTAPVSSSTITIMVFVRGAENLEFANPGSQLEGAAQSRWSYLNVQSSEEREEDCQSVVAGKANVPAPERFLLNMGEQVMTLRQLLRRSSLSIVRQMTADTAGVYVLYRQTMTRFPLQPGYDPTGNDFAIALVGGGSVSYNFSFMTPINYIMPAFVATRGSVIWNFNISTGSTPITHMRICRANGFSSTPGVNQGSTAVFASRSAGSRFYSTSIYSGSGGEAVTNQNTQSGLSALLPNYTAYKFESTRFSNASNAYAQDGTDYDCYVLEALLSGTTGTVVRNTAIWQYCGAGTDFNCHFFLNVPTLFLYPSVPLSA